MARAVQARGVRAGRLGAATLGALAAAAGAASGLAGGDPQAAEPAAQRPAGFRALLWRSEASVDELTRAVGGMCVLRGAVDLERQLEREQLDYFVFNAAGRDDLHLERERESWSGPWRAWLRDRDPARLRREPCLAAPATRERLASTLRETLASRDGPRGIGVSLGDEIGLTPGGAPHDVCQCGHCEREFAQWPGRAARPWLEVDGRALKLADISTDETCRALANGATAALGPWLARREFHQDQVQRVVAELAAQCRREAPAVGVGLLGLSGRTAFAGVAVDRALEHLDFIECYGVGDARELAFTLRNGSQGAWSTVFRDARGPDATAWSAWEHWMRGGDGVVVWSDRELSAEPQLAARLTSALARIRELDVRLDDFRPRPQGVALVHSPRSLSAAWLREAVVDGASWPNRFPSWQEQHGLYETARNAWLALSADCGAQCGSVPTDRIDERLARRFAVLVASNWLVVDDDELARVERFLSAGGALVVSGEFAWVDSAGRKCEPGLRAALSRRHPGRVIDAERGAERYGAARFDAELVERTRAVFARLGATLAPWRVPPGARPWLTTWSGSGAATVGALLPVLPDGERCEWPARLELLLDDDVECEWIHPLAASADARIESREVAGRELRVHSIAAAPGDAVVLRTRLR